ncbi:MAG: pilus assembly protein PilM, partial [Oscillospiraceae bacterium]
MLSFDVTDKQIKIVKGIQKGGRISISQTTVVDVPEGVVVNGFINDIARLATFVNDKLREKRMYDKEAVLSISSNQIVFKELSIPKTKGSEIYTMVQNQMHHNMNISTDYSISYTIVGESQEDKNHFYKILAEACPFEMVNNFKKLFNMLSIQLRTVIASANCISRVILADNKNKDRMP